MEEERTTVIYLERERKRMRMRGESWRRREQQ